jgi:hypothetical protein
MARKLKTYQTSLGFFEQAIAAPSMKAALEAWGADSNLFHQGAARESTHQDVIAAALAKPGVVLKRPVGSDGPFGEHAEVPKNLVEGGRKKPAIRPPGGKAKKWSTPPDKAADRKAAQAYEQERQRREREEVREEAAQQKQRERREQAIDKAQKALDQAEQEHAQRVTALHSEIEAIEKKILSEDDEWDKKEKRLRAALRRSRT